MNETRDNWECVQDAELARHPKPERLPGDEPPPPEPESIPLIAPSVIYEEETAALTEDPAPGDSMVTASPAAVAAASTENIVAVAVIPAANELLSLPPDLYAIQLVAMANEPAADEFKSSHEIEDALIVQLARDGELFYVVLLGIYDSFTAAEQAVEQRRESLADIEPWIRPLESIQTGLKEAESLIASSE